MSDMERQEIAHGMCLKQHASENL